MQQDAFHPKAGKFRGWRTHLFDGDDGGHLLDLLYDAVMNRQSPYELERDGWYAGEIHEAVGIWHEMVVFVRSQENGLSQAPGSGI